MYKFCLDNAHSAGDASADEIEELLAVISTKRTVRPHPG
jgi:hypothetical protein